MGRQMSSTPEWMRGAGETIRPARRGRPLGAIAVWALGLIIAANLAWAAMRLLG
jgi:hypothetical protein